MTRVLLVQTAHLGDLILTTPLLRALRDRLAGASITVLTDRRGAVLFEGLPDGPAPSVFLDRVDIAPDLSTARVFVSPAIPDQPYDEKEKLNNLLNHS